MSELKFSHPDDWRLAEHLATIDAHGYRIPSREHDADAIRAHLRESRRHQGYANFETFTVALVLDNAKELQDEAYATVYGARANEPNAELKRVRAADALKDWITGQLDMSARTDRNYMDVDHIDLQGMAETLLAAALAEVDWLELAEEYAKGEGE